MKIIHLVLGKANPERMNGVNKVVHKLASVQAELGYDVTVWGISQDLQHDYPIRNFPTQLFQQLSSKWTIDSALKKAIAALSPATVFHLHGAFIPEFYWVHRLLVKAQIAYVLTPHGALAPGAMQQSSWRKWVYLQLFEKQVLQKARAVQLLGQSGYDNTARLCPDSHQVLLPNGQDLQDLPELKRPQNQHIHFSFCGRLDRYHKGLDLLLEGFAAYRKAGGKGRLGLIGNGKDRDFLEAQATALKVDKAVIFYGACFGLEKFRLINKGDVFIHTSRMEGFPMAVLEAAGLGMPCLISEATNMGLYLREYEAGIVLTQNNPKNIAKALMQLDRLHQKGHLYCLGENARQMIIEQFDWERIARQLLRIYRKEEVMALKNTLD